MKLVNEMTQEELEFTIFDNNDGLYEMFDEQKFLNDEYTHEELLEITIKWIEEGDETKK